MSMGQSPKFTKSSTMHYAYPKNKKEEENNYALLHRSLIGLKDLNPNNIYIYIYILVAPQKNKKTKKSKRNW